MKILVLTDDRLGSAMAGSALRAWELANALASAGHEVRLTAAKDSSKPQQSPVELLDEPCWGWAELVVAPPWSLRLPAFSGRHLLVVDGATPLLAELDAMPSSPAIRRRRRTAAARLPLVAARAHAVLAAGAAQHEWWRAVLARRPEVPILEVPFGIQEHDPAEESADVIGVPSHLRHVVDELDELVQRWPVSCVGSHDQWSPRHQGNDTSPRDTSSDLLVVDVALIRRDCVWIGVAEDAGVLAAVDDFQGRALACV